MPKDNHEFAQPSNDTPIDVVAEELLRESEYFDAHSDLRRTNMISKIGHTIRTFIKQSLIISSPGLADGKDLGEMESYRRFLEGADDETGTF